MSRDWKVVRKGEIYCAPACGGDCTWAQYTAMKNQAKTMCKELGDGWKPQLNHNLGWFCAIVKGHTTIHCYHYSTGRRSYSAWIEFEVGGSIFQTINDHDNMKKALAKSVRQVKSLFNKMKKELNSLEI